MVTLRTSLLKKEPLMGGVPFFLRTGKNPDSDPEIFFLSRDGATLRRVWKKLREEILRAWIEEHPGSRPWAWWRFEAPRWGKKFRAWFDGTLPEPRRRLGGKGTPKFEALAVVPALPFGIPDFWVTDFDVSYYNGNARDIDGNPIGEEYSEGHFKGEAIDPADPPVFESEASYLRRHKLFLPGEEERIPPETWEPEAIRR